MQIFGSIPTLLYLLSGMFCVSVCPLSSAWPPRPCPLSSPCFRPGDLYTVYWDLYFYSITLTLIGIPMLSLFSRKPNVDIADAIRPSIQFTLNDDGIKD